MFKLRPYQEPIAKIVFDYLRKNRTKHPLIALPTGSGKTIVMAELVRQAITKWPDTHILILSHVKEILDQDYKALKFHTDFDIGINSAGLGRRERKQVTVAGIQSVHKQSYEFKHYNFIIVDECHLIPPSDTSMYRGFFAGLSKPRYLGLTATPFRLGAGKIYGQSDSIFNDLVYDLTSAEKFVQLIDNGYLCNLKTQGTNVELNTLNIGTKGGDFDQYDMSKAFNKDEITKAACAEIVKLGQEYKKWLIFAIDIEHAESIADWLTRLGIPTLVVHSKMEFDRDFVINTFKEGGIRAVVNVNVLTTGFDDPEIDLIALLRPTKSPVIHVQTIGRGLRVAPDKDHCLVLDFAGNTERLGPINDVRVRKTRKGQHPDEVGEPPTKKCPKCKAILPIKTKDCPWCKFHFKENVELRRHHSKTAVINTKKKIDWYPVSDVSYLLHQKKNTPDMVKVSYKCGMRYFNEYICMNHPLYAGHKARAWVRFRGGNAEDTKQLLEEAKHLKKPTKIKIDTRGKYPLIVDSEFSQ